MEARVARLEADVAHLRTDVADIKVTFERCGRSGRQNGSPGGEFDALKDSLASAKVWALLLYFALGAGAARSMARGFGWI